MQHADSFELTLKTKEGTVSCRKRTLVENSKYVYNLLKYQPSDTINLPYVNTDHLKFIIKHIKYGPPPVITYPLAEAFDVLALADYLIIETVHQSLSLYISNFVNISNAFTLVTLAKTFNSKTILGRSIYYIATNLPIVFNPTLHGPFA